MEHWRLAYLGTRRIPRDLSEFELATFFTFSAKEQALINARRGPLYRLALALHIGFLRMTGTTLDAYQYVPQMLWSHLGRHLGIEPPDLGTLRTLYETRERTLFDHQVLAYRALGFVPMAEHQRRYVVRWLKERLSGRPNRADLMQELKRWLYEHRILIQQDRALKPLLVQAARDIETALGASLLQAFGETTLERWASLLAQPHGSFASLQQWLWSVPLRNSTHQMNELFRKIDRLVELNVHRDWPAESNEAAVRHFARRCANRKPSVSRRIHQETRRLEVACFMRYALCTTTDQLLSMLGRWIRKAINEASSRVAATRPDLKAQIRDLATAVKAIATDADLTREEMVEQLCALADAALKQDTQSRTSLMRAQLVAKRRMARAMLAKLLSLPFEAQTAHPVIESLALLRELYAGKSNELPPDTSIHLGKAWERMIESEDRSLALLAFEWATLFALRVALRNGSVFVAHSFEFRSQATLLIPDDEWQAKRNHYYGHLALLQDPKEYLAPVIEHLDAGLRRLREAVASSEVRIDDAVHIGPLSAQPHDAALEALRGAILEPQPDGQLPRIILEIDSAVRFSTVAIAPRFRH